jgi:eukaryotic-like serine/threonine-protein kinase
MSPPKGEETAAQERRSHFLRPFLAKLRKRHIIETLAAFIGGGWLVLEFVDRLLVAHYHFPDETIDLTFITILAALISTVLWRWFRSSETKPGNVKVEVLLVPLVILATLAIDLNIILDMAGKSDLRVPIGIITLCLGIAWIIFKPLQWAARPQKPYAESAEKGEAILPGAAPAAARPDKSIIVLPFVNISPEEGQDYFCDGMTEEIITELSHLTELSVVSRNTAMTYKGTKKDTRTIGDELGVRYILEGSVRKAGNSLRITAQLIDASMDVHLWAEKYSGTLDDVFDMQEKVSRAIVDSLRIRLSPAEQVRLTRRPIADPEVYDDWLRARHMVRNYGPGGFDEAIARLETGLKRIGENPEVMAGLAFIYWHAGMLGSGGQDAFDRAVGWATRALALDGTLAHAHLTLGNVYLIRGKPKEALAALKAAYASEPGDWETRMWLAYLYAGVGRHSEALIHAKALLAIDPNEPMSRIWLCWVLLYDGRLQEAQQLLERAEFDLSLPHRRIALAQFRAWLGLRELALEILAPVEASKTYDYMTQLSLLLRDALRGDREFFRRDLTPDLVQSVLADAWGACTVAECCSLLGDAESALHWLDRAASWGWFNYPLYARTDPFFEPLRGDPRFQAFLERVKLQWETFEV